MSLPSNGIPSTTATVQTINLVPQGTDHNNLMNLGVQGHAGHSLLMNSQAAAAAAGTLMSLSHPLTADSNPRHPITNQLPVVQGHPPPLNMTSPMSSSRQQMAAAGVVGMNGSIPSTSASHRHPDNNNINMGGLIMPYNNITVKQERGVVPPGNPPGSLRHNSGQSPVQFPQLSSTDMCAGNIFSVQSANAAGQQPPLSKHICAVCGDRASGKHYGVYSCEGCKGFFKRTVRKYLTYTCRDEKECVIDKRQRNRCQFCRYKKCLSMGMKKEAVQDERQKTREQDETFSETSLADDMPVEKILEAELLSDPRHDDTIPDFETMEVERGVCMAADHQLYTLVDWAKRVPHFTTLSLDDQVTLLRAGWNELLIASFSHRSINHPDAIVLSIGFRVYRTTAHSAGVGAIFDRVLSELISKMRQMNMDRTELGCLRAIVLFNPDAKELSDCSLIESLREKVYASLEIYCRSKYPEQTGRFAKLLLRLPALRSIALKCLEHLFVFKLIGNQPINQFLLEKLMSEQQQMNSNNDATNKNNNNQAAEQQHHQVADNNTAHNNNQQQADSSTMSMLSNLRS